MPEFSCTQCGKKLQVKDELAGKKVRCPKCAHVLTIPAAHAVVPIPHAAPPPAAETHSPAWLSQPSVPTPHAAPPPAHKVEERTLPSSPSVLPANGLEPVSLSASDTRSDAQPARADLTADLPVGPPPEYCEFLAPPQGPGELGRLGGYRVLKVLGAGGMGVVYLAEDVALKRRVALKAMLPNLGVNATARQRFLREAQAAAGLHHDHVVAIYQVGEDRGAPFLAMEFLEGEPLDERLKRDGKLELAEVLRIGREIAEGLAAAHEHGLIHRDIKPANVWLEGKRGRVKILDFGLVRAADDQAHLTQAGAIVGTPAYMAPEQAQGGAVDARCDLFSLGCVLYRMAAGVMPFKGKDTISTLMAVATAEPPAVRTLNADVPPELAALVHQLLAKKPAERPASAQAVAETLEGIQRRHARRREDLTQVDGSPRRAGAPAPRSGKRWLVAAAVLLLLGGAGAVYWSGVLVRVETRAGTLLVKVDQPGAEVAVDGNKVTITPPGEQPVEVQVAEGRHTLRVSKGGFETFTDTFTLKSGGKETITVHLLARVAPPAPVAVAKPGPGPVDSTLPGIVPRPAKLPGIGRWQVVTTVARLSVRSVAWSPDGRLIASGGDDGLVRLHDAKTLQVVRVLIGHSDKVQSVAWRPDGQWLASASDDKTIRMWKPDGTPGPVLKGHLSGVNCVAWSPDGKQLASGGHDHTVRLWEADGTRGTVLRGHTNAVTSVAWRPDGKGLASGGFWIDTIVRLWQADGTAGPVLKGLKGTIRVAWAPDSGRLATSEDSGVRLWKADGTLERELKGTDKPVDALAWSPDGKYLASSWTAPLSFFQ